MSRLWRFAFPGWAIVPVAAFVASYAADLGKGFIKDDFAWILGSRLSRLHDLLELFRRDNGFYRPIVSATFGLNELLTGPSPLAFGLVNLALGIGCLLGVLSLGRALGMPSNLAVVAASLWALNPHGISWSILWISGRTALLLTLLSILSAWSLVRGYRWVAGAICLGALFSKEEAVLLPVVLAAWAMKAPVAASSRLSPRERIIKVAVPLCLPLVVYSILRGSTAAYLPFSAPPFYTPTFSPLSLGRNALEYVDRTFTLSVVAVLLAMMITRRIPRLDSLERRWALLGLIWVIGGFGLTIFLPVRSSLYVCFPLVGAALAAAAFIYSLWRDAAPTQRRRLRIAAVLVVISLVPIQRSRNARLVKTAQLSTTVLAGIAPFYNDVAGGKTVVLHDTPEARYSIEKSFGTLAQDAVRLTTGVATARVWVDPPPANWRELGFEPPTPESSIDFWLRDGRLIPAAALAPPGR